MPVWVIELSLTLQEIEACLENWVQGLGTLCGEGVAIIVIIPFAGSRLPHSPKIFSLGLTNGQPF